MSATSSAFDFRKSVAYDAHAKSLFHTFARCQLRKLAIAPHLSPHAYDLRSNKAAIAVSGEVTLHGDHLYVQASQPFGGFDSGVLFRTCSGRKDYVGGPNNFASVDLLHEPMRLARMVKQVTRGERP